MHRIDGAGHENHMFVAEDPATNRPPTEITPEIMNAFQEELATVIEWAGLVLAKGDNTQLKQAIQALQASFLTVSSLDAHREEADPHPVYLTSAEGDAKVAAAVAALVASSPATLDTLAEFATALGNDPNFATTLTNALALKASLNSPHLTGTPTAPTAAPGTNTDQLASTEFVKTAIAAAIIPGDLYGLALSTAGDSATMSIAAGRATDSTMAYSMSLANTIAKTTAAWAVGNAQGGLDTGAIANNAWYHFYEIKRLDTGVVDVIFSTNASAPTLPANYTIFRGIGSGLTNGSGQWTKFVQYGDKFMLDVPVTEYSGTNHSTAQILSTTVPAGKRVEGLYIASTTGGGVWVWLNDLSLADQTLSAALTIISNSTAGQASGVTPVFTNTSKQIRWKSSTDASVINILTLGWIDRRGRDA